MAVPTHIDPDQSIYIVSVEMGSGFRSTGREIDEYIREITYKFSRQTRRDIGAIRQRVNVTRDAGCFKFFKNYVTNDIGKEQLTRACNEADTEMKKIDPTLHVTPMFFKLDTPSLSQGNILTAMTEQLRQQVYERVLNRVQRDIQNAIESSPDGKISKKSKNALLKWIDKVGNINVLNDGEVTARIEAMKAQINAEAFIPMRDELLSYMDTSAEALELADGTPASAPEQTGQHDPDEQEYAAKPAVMPTHDIDLLDE